MLLSKLTQTQLNPLMRTEEVLPTGPHSPTDDGSACLSLVLYPERATG
jgi:hypothetical protein